MGGNTKKKIAAREAARAAAREEAEVAAVMESRGLAFIAANPDADMSDPRVLQAAMGFTDEEADSILDELADAGAIPRPAPRTRALIPDVDRRTRPMIFEQGGSSRE